MNSRAKHGCMRAAQVVLAVQLVLCLACASASLHWRQAEGFQRYHLALGDFSEGAQPGRRLRRQGNCVFHLTSAERRESLQRALFSCV